MPVSSKSSTARPFRTSVQGCIAGAAIVLALLIIQVFAWEHVAYASTSAERDQQPEAPTKNIADAKVSTVSVQSFTGKKVKPKIKVRYRGETLKRRRDYTLTYVNNIRPGKAKVIIKGKGAYTGSQECFFTISAKFVMVGDSYAITGASSKCWPARVAKRLCLPSERWSVCAENGYGFATGSFVDLVKYAKRDREVSDVLIIGGAGNDLPLSIDAVKSGYKRTIAAARKKWPNARIMHAIPNWFLENDWYQSTITSRYSLYRALAKTYGVQYLPKCEGILSGRWDRMFGDGNHPNAKGADAIAKAVVKDMRKWNRRPKDYQLRRSLEKPVRPIGRAGTSRKGNFPLATAL